MTVNIILILLITAVAVYAARFALRPLPADSVVAESTDRRVRKVLLVLTLVVGILGIVPLAGLPGFLWLEVAEPLGRKACPGRSWGQFQSGVSWPAAILMTPAWALSFLPAYRVARLATSRGRLVAGIFAAIALVAMVGIGLALFFYVLGCSW